MNQQKHWDRIYRAKTPSEVSWYQPEARLSLELIRRVAPKLDDPLLDVGGGASTLAHGLLASGYSDLTVLDLAAGLDRARDRMGERAGSSTVDCRRCIGGTPHGHIVRSLARPGGLPLPDRRT